MKREPVSSSTFRSAGYDARRHILEAEFRDGDIYRYEDVPDSVWKRFFAAPSKGRFFAFHIRDRYDFQKIKGPGEHSGAKNIGKERSQAMIKKDEIKPSHRTAREDPPEKRYNSRQNKVRDQNDSRKRDK